MITPHQVICDRCNKPVDRLVATEEPSSIFTEIYWRVRVWCHGESDLVVVDRLIIDAARPGDTLRAFIGAPKPQVVWQPIATAPKNTNVAVLSVATGEVCNAEMNESGQWCSEWFDADCRNPRPSDAWVPTHWLPIVLASIPAARFDEEKPPAVRIHDPGPSRYDHESEDLEE